MNAAIPEAGEPGRTDLWVVGNVLIDLMMKGVPEIPRWGEEVLATDRSEHVGGQGANLARAAVRLGLSTELAAVVGDDRPGAQIRETLEAGGVGTDALKLVAGRTAFAIAAVRQDGERAFITDLATSASLSVEEDLHQYEEAIHRSRAIALVGTSNLPGITLAAAARLLDRAQTRGVLTVFDPGWGDAITSGSELDQILQVTDVFLPNLDEARALTGQQEVGATLRALGDRCPGTVIVTCGEEGSAVLDGDELAIVEPLKVEVDSAVGAGDVFAAGVISGRLDDGDSVAAMVRGTAAAAKYISRSEERYDAIGAWRDLASQVNIRRL
jgi:sugar/nucleoside kinase (ribokinase family)